MLTYPKIDPVALEIGPLAVRWYGLMYLAAFFQFWWLGRRRILSHPGLAKAGWTVPELDDLLFFGVLGVIVGGRLGEVLFYAPDYYLRHPLEIFAVWRGGMSFHGGFLGVLAAMALYVRKTGRNWLDVTDFIAPLVPLGLASGRLGNFINGELWGKVTDMPWGVVFPTGGPLPRHPSQLYEAGLEGLVLFIILWWYASRRPPLGRVSGLFLLGYALARSFVEFFREPDAHIGYLAFGWLTMGQILCLPMIAAGLALLFWPRKPTAAVTAGEQKLSPGGKPKKRKKR